MAAGAAAALAAPGPLGGAAVLAAGLDTWQHPGREPQTYFHRTGPIGQVFTAYQDRLAGRTVGEIFTQAVAFLDMADDVILSRT